MAIKNDNYAKQRVDWSSKRNNEDRLRHRPHIINTANNRGSSTVRYYSSVDADIYFGNTFIDEVVNIAWQVQQNTMPLFGYNSFTFDDIAVGSRIISGQFAVNYTESNYLTKVLDTLTKISRQMYGEDIPATSKFTDSDRIRRNTPIWDAGFDLMVGFGEKYNDSYESIVILDCCQITGCTQQLDYNGEPVIEVYSFIARDMKFSQVSTVESAARSIVSTSTTSEELEIETSETVKSRNIIDLSIIDSTIFINGSNRQAVLEIEPLPELESAYLFIRGVDDKVFALGKEGKITKNSVTFNLTAEEKRILSKHIATYGNRIQTDLKYYMNLSNKTIPKETTIIFKVTS